MSTQGTQVRTTDETEDGITGTKATGRRVPLVVTVLSTVGALVLGAGIAGGIGAAAASSEGSNSAALADELTAANEAIEDLQGQLSDSQRAAEDAEAAAAASDARAVAAENALALKEAELAELAESAGEVYQPTDADIIAAATQRFHDAAQTMGMEVGPLKDGCTTHGEVSGTVLSYITVPPNFGVTDSLYVSAEIKVSTAAENSIDYAWYTCPKD